MEELVEESHDFLDRDFSTMASRNQKEREGVTSTGDTEVCLLVLSPIGNSLTMFYGSTHILISRTVFRPHRHR